jgi:hypothetical protein
LDALYPREELQAALPGIESGATVDGLVLTSNRVTPAKWRELIEAKIATLKAAVTMPFEQKTRTVLPRILRCPEDSETMNRLVALFEDRRATNTAWDAGDFARFAQARALRRKIDTKASVPETARPPAWIEPR